MNNKSVGKFLLSCVLTHATSVVADVDINIHNINTVEDILALAASEPTRAGYVRSDITSLLHDNRRKNIVIVHNNSYGGLFSTNIAQYLQNVLSDDYQIQEVTLDFSQHTVYSAHTIHYLVKQKLLDLYGDSTVFILIGDLIRDVYTSLFDTPYLHISNAHIREVISSNINSFETITSASRSRKSRYIVLEEASLSSIWYSDMVTHAINQKRLSDNSYQAGTEAGFNVVHIKNIEELKKTVSDYQGQNVVFVNALFSVLDTTTGKYLKYNRISTLIDDFNYKRLSVGFQKDGPESMTLGINYTETVARWVQHIDNNVITDLPLVPNIYIDTTKLSKKGYSSVYAQSFNNNLVPFGLK